MEKRSKPVMSWAADTVRLLKTMQQYCMVHGVECCGQIEQRQHCQVSFINC
jgi:hypothetical protein